MANWKYTVDFSKFWNDENISVPDKGKLAAKQIRKAFPKSWFDFTSNDYDSEIDEIAEAFEHITGYDDVTPTEEFDNWMKALYDFADYNHTAWIKTNF